MILYHNPNCSKSRATKALLEEKNIDFTIKHYLNDEISANELKAITKKLGLTSIKELLRHKEDIYLEKNIAQISDEQQLIDLVLAHPKLIERPILVTESAAAIGRPPENVLTII